MSQIESISALEILDSRGNPTIEVTITLEDGTFASGIAPSGASTGKKEAHELRDKDKRRYHGKGVLNACSNVENEISEAICGMDVNYLREIDQAMIDLDGTKNKSKLGANAILATSIACAKAASESLKIPLYQFIGGCNSHVLPVPMMNIINGGAHADNSLAIQEFMIMPISASTFAEALRMGSEIFHTLKSELKDANFSTNVGDEGGFAPNFVRTTDALDFIMKAIEKSGYRPNEDVVLALDCAASEFFANGQYKIDGIPMSSSDLIGFYDKISQRYPIFSLEDPLAEDDHDGFIEITKRLGERLQIVGDDLFCTNKEILIDGVKKQMANALLVKFNQIGTISETLDAMDFATRSKYNCVVSHRSGESEDTTIAHLAVGKNAGQIKTGSLCRTDRIAKYNELLRIEQNLGDSAVYAGSSILKTS